MFKSDVQVATVLLSRLNFKRKETGVEKPTLQRFNCFIITHRLQQQTSDCTTRCLRCFRLRTLLSREYLVGSKATRRKNGPKLQFHTWLEGSKRRKVLWRSWRKRFPIRVNYHNALLSLEAPMDEFKFVTRKGCLMLSIAAFGDGPISRVLTN